MIKLFAVICVVACVYGLPQPQPDEPVPQDLTPIEADPQVFQAFVAEAQPEDDLSGAESRHGWGHGGGGWGHGGGGWGHGGGWGGHGHGGWGHGGRGWGHGHGHGHGG